MQNKVLLIDNLSDWLNVGDIFNENTNKKLIMIGKYEFVENNGKTFMILSKSNPKFLNGKYSVTVDTLEYNRKFHNFKMTFASDSIKIVGLKSTTYIDF